MVLVPCPVGAKVLDGSGKVQDDSIFLMSLDGLKVIENVLVRDYGHRLGMDSNDDFMDLHHDTHSMDFLGNSIFSPIHDSHTHEFHVDGTMESSFLEPNKKNISPLLSCHPLAIN